MAREVSTTEALMTDPTTPEGADYWQERHIYERDLERALSAPECPVAQPSPSGGWDLCSEVERTP